jgi:hypothetical protein
MSTKKQLREISAFVSNPKVLTALEKAGTDQELLRQAEADPIAFLKGEGLLTPRGTDVKIMYSKKQSKKKTITYTVKSCTSSGGTEECVEMKVTITVTKK